MSYELRCRLNHEEFYRAYPRQFRYIHFYICNIFVGYNISFVRFSRPLYCCKIQCAYRPPYFDVTGVILRSIFVNFVPRCLYVVPTLVGTDL